MRDNPAAVGQSSLSPKISRVRNLGRVFPNLFGYFNEISLTKRFALASFAILVAGMILIGWWVTQQIEKGVMNRTAAIAASFVTSMVSPHLQTIGQSGQLGTEQTDALNQLLYTTDLGERIVSFKVWSKEGRILYSTQSEIIGQVFPVKSDLAKVFQGETVSHVSNLSDPENVYERQRFQRLQETYTPVRSLGTGEIIGAVEFYESTDALASEVQSARLQSWAIIGGATLAMYLLLLGMVKGASITIGRQRNELAMVAAQKELDRLKAEFSSALSHELRTPLGFIKGYATTLLRDDIVIDRGTNREFLNVIADESIKLEKMIDELLDTSRLQAGKFRIDRKPSNLGNLMKAALQRAVPILENSGHIITTDVASDNTMVFVDAGRIEQVLFNLLDNASRYSSPSSQIRVETKTQRDEVLVMVKDRGTGIDVQELERIFAPFYRGEGSSSSRIKGAGLGLAISRGIIEAHGGRLWVESRKGHGSTFFFTLPITGDKPAQFSESDDQSNVK